MRRIGKIVLEYTPQELASVIQQHITTTEKVSIEAVEYKNDKIVFHCIEGINNLGQQQQASLINLSFMKASPTRGAYSKGVKASILDILANGVLCPLDNIIKELELKGIKKKKAHIKSYIRRLSEVTEAQPEVFQLTSFFNKLKQL